MIDANGLIEIFKSSPDESLRFGTVDSNLRIVFDGETKSCVKNFACLNYTLTEGDRVAIVKHGQTYLVLGKIGLNVVPPVLLAAETDSTGSTVTLTFERSMSDPTGKAAQFSIVV